MHRRHHTATPKATLLTSPTTSTVVDISLAFILRPGARFTAAMQCMTLLLTLLESFPKPKLLESTAVLPTRNLLLFRPILFNSSIVIPRRMNNGHGKEFGRGSGRLE
jgi:hypothetical protein